ncbi:MAG: hypothetical protein LW817_04690 [Candidatus Caenarcaniphilales bacterium]|nr:hypothetical protein [Candidatus Caenarcaniphilales bacterium]
MIAVNPSSNTNPNNALGAKKPVEKNSFLRLASHKDSHASVLDQNLNDLIQAEDLEKTNNRVLAAIHSGAQKATELAKNSGSATNDLLHGFGVLGKSAFGKFIDNPSFVAGATGIGALIAGVQSIKSATRTASSFFNAKQDDNPWLLHGAMSLLLAGLTAGLAAPFIGVASPFTKIMNDQKVVQVKTLLGAIIAPVALSSFMKASKGVSLFSKIPFLGGSITEIAKTVNQGIRHVALPEVNVSSPQGAGQIAGAPG